jgi:hypothetical protein
MNAAFKILSEIRDIETIAAGRGGWRKLRGIATVELADGTICEAEIHWYEAHGIGRKDFKIKKVRR